MNEGEFLAGREHFPPAEGGALTAQKRGPLPPPPAGTNVGLVKNFRNSLLADVF